MEKILVIVALIAVSILIIKNTDSKGSIVKKKKTNALIGMPVIFFDGKKRKGGTAKMAQGLQVFDADGNLVCDVTTRFTRILGSGRTGYADGSITDDKLKDGEVWAYVTGLHGKLNDTPPLPPIFSAQGNTLSWEFPVFDETLNNKAIGDFSFVYGIY